jgi:cell division septal protein FtsQ
VRRLLANWRALLVVTVAVGAFVGGRVAIGHLPFFRIGAVEVVGLRYLDEREVVAQLAVPPGASILEPLGPIVERARRVQGLRTARLSRRWPGTLRLVVEEAPPVAIVVEEGMVRVIDDRAELLPYPPGRVEFSLPLADRDSTTAALLGRLQRADPTWYARFDRTELSDGDVRLVAGEQRIRLPNGADEALLRRAAAVRGWLEQRGIGWWDLDMRFRGRAFVRRVEG